MECVLCEEDLKDAGFVANGMCPSCFAGKYGGTTFKDENGNTVISGCVVTDPIKMDIGKESN